MMSLPITNGLSKVGYSEAKSTLGRAKALRRLGSRHKLIIALHLKGNTGPQIAAQVGCSVGMVYTTLKDPAASIVIDHFSEGLDFDVKSLFPKVIKAISEALDDEDRALPAVDRYIRLVGKDEAPDKGGISITVLGNARLKLVQEIRDSVENIVDITPKELETD